MAATLTSSRTARTPKAPIAVHTRKVVAPHTVAHIPKAAPIPKAVAPPMAAPIPKPVAPLMAVPIPKAVATHTAGHIQATPDKAAIRGDSRTAPPAIRVSRSRNRNRREGAVSARSTVASTAAQPNWGFR